MDPGDHSSHKPKGQKYPDSAELNSIYAFFLIGAFRPMSQNTMSF
jgi:hypothetical protein